MTVPPESARIPESFASTGDPVDGNPFPLEDARHKIWHEATLKAEEEVCQINYNASLSMTPDNALDLFLKPAVAKFNAWAKRGVHVVWSEGALQQYDQWLLSYANAWIDSTSGIFARHPPPFSVEMILTDLRNQLGRQIQFWKGEARRYRADQELQRKSLAAEAPQGVSAAVVKRRKLLVKRYRSDADLTAAAFARKVGISDAAIRGIVREDLTRFALGTRDKLLAALGIERAEWYRE